MIPEIKNVTAGKLVNALERDGFKRTIRKGGHRVYRHPDGRRVTVSFHHSGATFRPKTLSAMLEDAGWDEKDLRRVKLIK